MLSLRTLPIYHRTCRLPKLARGDATIAHLLGAYPAKALSWLRPGLGYLPSEPLPPTTAPDCPPEYDACAHSPSCLHRSHEAPLFSGLHRLAIHASGTWLRLPTITHSQLGAQGIVGMLADPCASPLSKVPIDNLPGR